MTKIVYNACFGGFSLSDEAFEAYLDRKGIPWRSQRSGFGYNNYFRSDTKDENEGYLSCYDIERTDPDLVAVVEEMGDKANGSFAKLRIEVVPEGSRYRINEYDGNESVMTRDDYDWKIA